MNILNVQTGKKALQHNITQPINKAIIESVALSSISVWFGSTTSCSKGKQHHVAKTAEKVIGSNIPSTEDLYLNTGQS